MSDNPYLSFFYFILAGYLFHLWWQDRRAFLQGKERSKPLPGAKPCTKGVLFLAIAASAVIIGAETWGEIQLGISSEQNVLPSFALFSICAAAVIEEMLFRGFLADFAGIDRRPVWLGALLCLGFSMIFALFHEHLWQWDDEGFRWQWTSKAFFSSGVLMLNSLWFFYLRFCRWNSQRSLLPCMLGHLCSNLLVYAIKAVQGFIAW